MSNLDKFEKDWRDAEAKAIRLQNEKDEQLQKLMDRFADKLREAVDEAAAKQKVFLDAQAAAALVGRDDAETVAANLGLTLPE